MKYSQCNAFLRKLIILNISCENFYKSASCCLILCAFQIRQVLVKSCTNRGVVNVQQAVLNEITLFRKPSCSCSSNPWQRDAMLLCIRVVDPLKIGVLLIGFAITLFLFISLKTLCGFGIELLPVEMRYRMRKRAHDFFTRPKSQGATPIFLLRIILRKNVPANFQR